MNSYMCFNQPMSHKGIEVRLAPGDVVANQPQGICVKPMSG